MVLRSAFFVNHTRTEQVVPLPWAGFEHLSQREAPGEIKLSPHGVAVLTRLAVTPQERISSSR